MSRAFFARTLVCFAALLASGAQAAWPERPIRIVVPYAAGASGDLVVRAMQPALQERLGQPVIVDNRTGAGGNIGTQEVVRAKPDGYTLVLGATNNFVINQFVYPNLGFDPLQALVPVTKLVDVPSVLLVNAALPARSYAEFAEYAKVHAGKLNYGSPGAGTAPHLSSFALSQAMGANMVHVPFRGAAPGVQGLLGNEVQMFLVGYGLAAGHIASGRVRALAVASNERLASAPNIPTAKEAGMPDVVLGNWWGLAAPKGTDPAIVERIAREVRAVLEQPATRSFLVNAGFVPVAAGPERFARDLPAEAQAWQSIVKAAGTKLDP